jgi:hypothetical protein
MAERTESHTVTYVADGIHFTMDELRDVVNDLHPHGSTVKFISGHRAGEKFAEGQRYPTDRNAVLIVVLPGYLTD